MNFNEFIVGRLTGYGLRIIRNLYGVGYTKGKLLYKLNGWDLKSLSKARKHVQPSIIYFSWDRFTNYYDALMEWYNRQR